MLSPPWRTPEVGDLATLGEKEAHVWRIDFENYPIAAPDVCSDSDAGGTRDSECRNPGVVSVPRLAKRLLPRLLAPYLGVSPDSVRVGRDERGKAYILGTDLQLNLSHSGTLAVYAFCRAGAVGVDIEEIRAIPACNFIAQQYFAPQEYKRWNDEPAATKTEVFARLWTRKEAYVKALGAGLHYQLPGFDVSAPSRCELGHDQNEPYRVLCWRLISFIPSSGYAGALAVRPIIGDIRWFDGTKVLSVLLKMKQK